MTEAFLALIALGMVAGAVWAYLADEPVAGSLLAAGAVFVGHLVGFQQVRLADAPTARP